MADGPAHTSGGAAAEAATSGDGAFHVRVDGIAIAVTADTSVAAAVLMAGHDRMRRSVTGQPRGPLCGMGICFECRVTIDGVPQRLSCQAVCAPGMEVRTDAP